MNNNQNRFLSGEGLKYCSVRRRSYAFFVCACTYVTILEAQAEHLTLCRCDSGLYLLSSTFHIIFFLRQLHKKTSKAFIGLWWLNKTITWKDPAVLFALCECEVRMWTELVYLGVCFLFLSPLCLFQLDMSKWNYQTNNSFTLLIFKAVNSGKKKPFKSSMLWIIQVALCMERNNTIILLKLKVEFIRN